MEPVKLHTPSVLKFLEVNHAIKLIGANTTTQKDISLYSIDFRYASPVRRSRSEGETPFVVEPWFREYRAAPGLSDTYTALAEIV
jgi:hypothetical protein